jgi:hypothetical protein
MLQYADDLTVYVAQYDVENVKWTVQSAFDGLNRFFRNIGLSISESKSELVLFSIKHTNSSVYVTLNGHCMPVGPEISVPWCGVRQKTSMTRTRALHSAEMLQVTKLFAIYIAWVRKEHTWM